MVDVVVLTRWPPHLEPATIVNWVRDGVCRVVVLTSWNISGVITEKGEIIEYGALWAADLTWVHAILAYVEVTAIIGVKITSVIIFGTIGSNLGGVGA